MLGPIGIFTSRYTVASEAGSRQAGGFSDREGHRSMRGWTPAAPDVIRKRYNQLASIYPVFEYVFWLPKGVRAEAVRRLELAPGQRALEVGCGTGRNFDPMVGAVGRSGHIYGVDLSEGMLRIAQRRCVRRGWTNVTLLRRDASEHALPGPVDAALFSFSYEVIPEYRKALRNAWSQLRLGGHLVILGQRTPQGMLGRWLRPIGVTVSRATVLGDPDRCAWEDLRELTARIDLEERKYGYYICRGTKVETQAP